MIPELGNFTLILALVLSLLQVVVPYKYPQAARPLAFGVSCLLFLSMLALLYALVNDDFSVQYVASHSNAALPLLYKISTAWSAHEGSLLLWVLILSLWAVVVAISSNKLPLQFSSSMLSIMALVNLGMLWFLVATSNPFTRLLPNFPMDGNDLSPLLQDKGLMLHPPILYCGYIGMVVPYAFAVAALLAGKLATAWLQWLKPLVLAVVCCLTIGITTGSWWAYYELGWGGWWFWDPVENVSFMPWLIALALLHCLMVAARRKLLCGWVLILSIAAFSLSVLGTFVVRSGTIESVHAFASSPERGEFLLKYLLACSSTALLLFICRIKKIISDADNNYKDSVKYKLFVVNAVLLSIVTISILLGTMLPLFYELVTDNKIVISSAYFNMIFIPLVLPILILMPIAPLCKWDNTTFKSVLWLLRYKILLSIILAMILPYGFAIVFWIIINTYNKRNNIGMWLAHLGIAVIVLGITVVSHYQIEAEHVVQRGSIITLGAYKFKFIGESVHEGSNFIGHRGEFTVTQGNKTIATMHPEKRLFLMSDIAVSEVAIDVGLFRDLYIGLGTRLPSGAWTINVHYKPLVRCIWLGGLLVALGIFLAALKARRVRVK
ncbi:MAG: heme lyase NrfEFG subunit NrfE [Legionellales bacterium]|nr:MAG: heme lyase NrfEFG subunit NrfE [Legionellales bacterium]